jgi:hypothetical protein
MYLQACCADSWVEISSQPSSSSLSSAGADNEIITTGLQIRHDLNIHRQQRRRRLHRDIAGGIQIPGRPASAAGSSQDEYDESESESDRVVSSSNEDITTRHEDSLGRNRSQVDEYEDDNSTTLGRRTFASDERVFTPQPNAFSHPPSSQTSRHTIGSTPTSDSYFPPTTSSAAGDSRHPSNQTIIQRNIQPSRPRLLQPQTARSSAPCNMVGPTHTYQPDHDAALRASLSTLLSCAAAVRGSPKQESSTHIEARNQSEPITLRLVPESELFGPDNGRPPPLPARKPRAASPPSSASLSPKAATKRKARELSKDRHSKKSRATKTTTGNLEDATVSPVLMSWMISAGVVLVFSAISFSVGYAWGKEAGRFEGNMGVTSDGATCGREAMRGSTGGLRRLRWGTASTSVRA